KPGLILDARDFGVGRQRPRFVLGELAGGGPAERRLPLGLFDSVRQPGNLLRAAIELAVDPALEKPADDQDANDADHHRKDALSSVFHRPPPCLDVVAGVFAAGAFAVGALAAVAVAAGVDRSATGRIVIESSKLHCSSDRFTSCSVPFPVTTCCLSLCLFSSSSTRSAASTCPENLMNPPPPLPCTWA